MTAEPLTFLPGRWFGLTMYPGYADVPYVSPIAVERVTASGARSFELAYLNLAYASGVQNLVKVYRTLKRTKSYLAAEEVGNLDRTLIFEHLTAEWMRRNFSEIGVSGLFDASGEPSDVAFRRI